MKTLIAALRQECLAKPGVQKDELEDEEYGVLGGSLDGFARFILDESPPVLMLRCRNAVRKKWEKISSAVRVSERMFWETKGWTWTDVLLDGSIPQASLSELLEDSYQLVYESLSDDQKLRIALLMRKLNPRALLAPLIAHYRLTRWRREIVKLLKPAFLLKTKRTTEARLPLGQTKIGGRPDLPAGYDWPTYRDGKPLAFLAQVNLTELPPGAKRGGLPPRGILYFFSVFGWQIENDADPQLPPGEYEYDWTQVLYHPDNSAALERRRTPAKVNAFKAAHVEFVPILTLPTVAAEPPVAKLQWKRNTIDKYTDLVYAYKDICDYQLGNPERNLLLGFADYEQVFVDAVGEQNLQLLFQLASDDHAEMCWGDGGFIYFWVRPQDLTRRDFKRIHTDYQCG